MTFCVRSNQGIVHQNMTHNNQTNKYRVRPYLVLNMKWQRLMIEWEDDAIQIHIPPSYVRSEPSNVQTRGKTAMCYTRAELGAAILFSGVMYMQNALFYTMAKRNSEH